MGKKGRLALGLFALVALVIALLLWVALQGDDGNGDPQRAPDVTAPGSDARDDAATQQSDLTPERRRRQKGEGRLSGRLLRHNDRRPVAGQRVVLHIAQEDPLETTTDENGFFVFENLPRRTALRLEVVAPELGFVSIPGIRLKRRRSRDLGDLMLAPSSRVKVIVTSSLGEPVVGAEVQAFRLGAGAVDFGADVAPSAVATVSSNAAGEALFPQLSVGSWNFVVSARGHARRATGVWEMQAGAGERKFEVTLDGGTTLTGTVVDRSGTPVAGVAVVALRRTVTADATNAPLAARTRTDGSGKYTLTSLPPADLVLWTARRGEPLAVAAAVRVPGIQHFDLTLPEPSTLRGTLRDEEGSALVGADVEATIQLDNRLTLSAHATTDDEGWYDLVFSRAGRVIELTVSKASYILPPDQAPLGVRLFAGNAHESHLVVTRGATIEGVIRSHSGPVTGAYVATGSGPTLRETSTDGSGFYRLEGVTASGAQIHAEKWGYADATMAKGFEALTNLAPGGTVVVDLHMQQGAPLSGVVVDANGQPVPNAEVFVDGDDEGWRVRSNGAGRFTLPSASPSATVTLGAKAEGFTPGFGRVTTAKQGPTGNARIVMRPLTTIRGKLTSSTGEPLTNAYVQVAGHGGGRLDPIALEWAWLSFERWSVRPDGTFEHPAPIADKGFVVHASAGGHAPTSSACIALIPGRSDYTVDLTLQAGEELRGQVTGSGVGPVSGAHVAIVRRPDRSTATNWRYPGALGPATAAVTDRHGHFQIDHLPPGTYGLEVTHADYRPTRVIRGVPGESGDVLLIPRHVVTGQVFDFDGRPARNGELVFRSQSDSSDTSVRCDQSGRFEIDLPTAGTYDVSLHMARDSEDVETLSCGSTMTGRRGEELTARRE